MPREQEPPAPAWAAILFSVIGAGFLAAALTTGWTQWQFVQRAETGPGSVVRLNAGGSHPQIRFTTRTGEVREYPQGGLIFGYAVDEAVKVLYDPGNPRDAVVCNFGAIWSTPGFLLLLGLGFAVGGASAFRQRAIGKS